MQWKMWMTCRPMLHALEFKFTQNHILLKISPQMAPLSAERNSRSMPVAADGTCGDSFQGSLAFQYERRTVTNWAGQIWYGVNGREGLKRLPSPIEEETTRQKIRLNRLGTGKGYLFAFDNR
jgi:hypothetical protein